MFNNIIEDGKKAVLDYFPERQIYLRSGGEVNYYVLKTRTQLIIAGVASFLALWCLVTIFNLFWGLNPLAGQAHKNRLIKAEYERLLEDAQAKYQNAQLQLTQQQETFERAARSFQEKHAAIAQLVDQPVIGDSLPVFSSKNYVKGEILQAPTVRDSSPRQSRRSIMQTAELVTGTNIDRPLTTLGETQNAILLSAESSTLDKIERSRAIIEATDIGVQKVLAAGGLGRGGPLLSLGKKNDEDSRVNSIKARTYEAKVLENAIESVPFGHPVAADHYETSSFGVRKDPFTQRPAMHEGIDIASYNMAPIVATAPGTIKYVGRNGGYGRTVVIDHGHGFTTRYAHLEKTYVKRGQKVEKGDTIAGMGSTGRSTSTHLHYEVRFQGNVYDPEKFFKAGRYVQ